MAEDQVEVNNPTAKPFFFNQPNTGVFSFEVDGQKQKTNRTWFRGEHCNFNPKLKNMHSSDAVLKHVLAGWLPDTPLITPQTRITAFGSCFAQNISDWLVKRNFNVLSSGKGDVEGSYVIRFGEGMVNTFVILQQFEWAFENKFSKADLWYGYDCKSFGYKEAVRLKTYKLFMNTDIFILTMGLSEVWYDEVTGGVFWRTVPQDKYDATRHKFRVSTVQENKDNIRAIYDLIRKHRPEAKIIFTMSPIPLVATFRDVSCITANSASKAILRAALDEFFRDVQQEKVAYYWPSYEIILDVFDNRWNPDRRHVKQPILDFVMTLFESTWCQGVSSDLNVAEAWFNARLAAGSLPDLSPNQRQFRKLRNDPYLYFADSKIPLLRLMRYFFKKNI